MMTAISAMLTIIFAFVSFVMMISEAPPQANKKPTPFHREGAKDAKGTRNQSLFSCFKPESIFCFCFPSRPSRLVCFSQVLFLRSIAFKR
jgi:hypothetical protein